jgi:hypothetical protein
VEEDIKKCAWALRVSTVELGAVDVEKFVSCYLNRVVKIIIAGGFFLTDLNFTQFYTKCWTEAENTR